MPSNIKPKTREDEAAVIMVLPAVLVSFVALEPAINTAVDTPNMQLAVAKMKLYNAVHGPIALPCNDWEESSNG